jgi:hypothetical protein
MTIRKPTEYPRFEMMVAPGKPASDAVSMACETTEKPIEIAAARPDHQSAPKVRASSPSPSVRMISIRPPPLAVGAC